MSTKSFLRLTNSFASLSESNLCFVNAAFQSLCSLPNFEEYFKSLNPSDLVDKPVSQEIARVLQFSIDRTEVSLSKLRTEVGKSVGKDYSQGNQEDSQEFLKYLLEALTSEGVTSVTSKFKGARESVHREFATPDKKCDICHMEYKDIVSEKVQNLDYLTAEIPSLGAGQTISIDTLLKRKYNTKSQILLKCPNCCDSQNHIGPCNLEGVCSQKRAYESTKLIDLPKVLIVMMPTKTGVIPVPLKELDLTDKTYRLRAVINHSGVSRNSGHYTAIVWDGQHYYKLDDANNPSFRMYPTGIQSQDNYIYISMTKYRQTDLDMLLHILLLKSLNLK